MAQNTANENAEALEEMNGKLTFIQVQSAVTLVIDLQNDYDAHMRLPSPERTMTWQRDRDEKKRILDAAIEFRDCLMEGRSNCNQLRRW